MTTAAGIVLLRTDASHSLFRELVTELDEDLKVRDGDDHGFYAQFNKPDHIRHVVVALIGNKPAGCGAFKFYEEGTMEIKRMYVPPEFRRRSIASQVLGELESWCRELGVRRCILETGIRQPEAIELYLKQGYSRIPNYGQYAGVADSVCFEKWLK